MRAIGGIDIVFNLLFTAYQIRDINDVLTIFVIGLNYNLLGDGVLLEAIYNLWCSAIPKHLLTRILLTLPVARTGWRHLHQRSFPALPLYHGGINKHL